MAAEQQRTTLATRPLIEALADKSRAAFDVKTSSTRRPRSESLRQKWKHAFTNTDPKRQFAARAFQFMFTDKFDSSGADRWVPVRPLGAGSYGAVGLFEHRDDDGLVEDYVVAKYAEVCEKDSVRKNISGISREAAIMMQLNEIPNSEGVLFLRNFRHYADNKMWLHLLEYCPSLDLEGLRLTYKAMRKTFPEAFLWYTFYALAKGLVTMEEGPFGEDLKPSKVRNGAYLVHRDLKPSNTFMGYSHIEQDPDKVLSDPANYMGTCLDYPHAKIADFGLSKITTNGDPENTAYKQAHVGTAQWRPPEMRINQIPPYESKNQFPSTCFDADGDPMDKNTYKSKGQHAHTPAGNTFVVGYMMYQLMTMDEPNTLDKYLNRILAQLEDTPTGSVLDTDTIQERTEFLNNVTYANPAIAHLHTDEDKDNEEILTMLEDWRDVNYSDPLKTLIEDCLSFNPTDRPLASDLLQEISKYMLDYLSNNSGHPDFESEAEVFHRPEDLSNMEVGVEPFHRDKKFWDRLQGMHKWLDPSGGYIRPDLLQPDVTKEAIAFFTPGRREQKNKAAATSTQSYEDSDAVIRILNGPSSGSVGPLLVGAATGVSSPVAEIRLSDESEQEDDESTIKVHNSSRRRKRGSGEVSQVSDNYDDEEQTPVANIRLDAEDDDAADTSMPVRSLIPPPLRWRKVDNNSSTRREGSGNSSKRSKSSRSEKIPRRMFTSRVRGVVRNNDGDDDDEDESPPAFANTRWDEDEEEENDRETRTLSPPKRRKGARGRVVRVRDYDEDEYEDDEETPTFANVSFFGEG